MKGQQRENKTRKNIQRFCDYSGSINAPLDTLFTFHGSKN